MKKLVALILSLIAFNAFSCDMKDAQYLMDEGIAESAANDCKNDGLGLKKLSDSLKHFVSMVEAYEDSCETKFSPGIKKILIENAIRTAKSCVANH